MFNKEKKIKELKHLTKKSNRITILAMFSLVCLFSGIVQARTEIPDNLIEIKDSKINEMILSANDGISLNRTHVSGTESITLDWTAIDEVSKYSVYQGEEGTEEKEIATVEGTSITLDKDNAGITDKTAPDAPKVTATKNAEGTGYNLSFEPSNDNGTTYRHWIEVTVKSDIKYVEGDLEEEAIKTNNGKDSVTTRGTFTVPEGVTKIRVACVGGGGGDSSHNSGVDNGEDSFFGSVIATGGTAYSVGTPNGLSYQGRRDGYGFEKSFTMTIIPSGYGSAYDNYSPHTSGSGGYISTYLDVTPGEKISWQAGRGSHKGKGGFVLIAYGGEIQPVVTKKSNTVSTTITSGIKGYQYAVTTSPTHKFIDEEIVQLNEIPTYVSSEEEMTQYLHIRAVDNNGNVSNTKSILLQVPAKITLKSDYVYGMNEVPLSWKINDSRDGYVYRLYQREDGKESFAQIASSNSTEIVKEIGQKTSTYTTPGTYTWVVPKGVKQVKVAAVGGGAGGLTIADYDGRSKTGLSGTGGNGGDSSFGSFVAEGGKGASGEAKTWSYTNGSQGPVAVPNGKLGEFKMGHNFDRPGHTCWVSDRHKNPLRGATGFDIGFTMKEGTYGAGGNSGHYFDSDGTAAQVGAGGNSGAYNVGYVDVTPGETIRIVVGEGGKGLKNENDTEYGRYDVTDGTSGYVYIQYDYEIYEPVIYGNSTTDLSATDKVAPAVLELFLNGIKGDTTKYEIGIVAEDYGTLYEHYVTGQNKRYNMYVTSNIVSTEVITGIAGYSWKIDSNPYGQPDGIIGYDDDGNTTTTFPKTISTDYLNEGYYLHVRAIDKAGNVGATTHLYLEAVTITLTSHYDEYADFNGYGPNYVPLTWTNTNQKDKFYYKLFQKDEDKSEWTQVSTNYGKVVKVLNVYPTADGAASRKITFTSALDGKQYTIPKSASLKQWMEEANSEEPKGYGKGLISVDIVSLPEFNANPDSYLKANGEYQYDVIMFGSWDFNGKTGSSGDLSKISAQATREFINAGRGVLFGHDTISIQIYHENFISLADLAKQTVSRSIPRVGSSTVKVVKKGYITKYPYDIETRNLTIPYSHTTGEFSYGDIWIKYINIDNPQEDYDFNNYFITTWNNCAVTRTGHSNGAATPDEQKILANTLFYLGQVTNDTYANVYTAEDFAEPEISDIKIRDNYKANRLELDIKGIDYGSSYDHYVLATKLITSGTYYSNTVHTTVKTGVNKFQYTINDSKTEYTGNEYEVSAINKESCTINIDKSNIGKYLHIRPIDNAGNAGEITTIYLDGARTISREERNETEELYCVEEEVLIPAEYDGTQSDATVEVAGKKETLNWPLNLQKLFELYKEDGAALRNPYTQSGQSGFVDKSNTLGRYKIERVPGTVSGKQGNASEIYAYILSYYSDNNIENSDSQNALYEVIAEENGATTDGSRRNLLYYEAKEYEKFKELLKSKGGFIPTQLEHEVQVGFNVENKDYIIGPFEVDYIRNCTTITDGKGNSKTVNFSGIGVASGNLITNKNGIRIYDQNGKEIPQNTWSIEYDNKAEKEKTRAETYAEYEMPLPKEEFYIKLTQKANVTDISKIEIEYYEIEADAKYSILNGDYSTVTWNANQNSNICGGGTLCPHGRTNPHVMGHTYYISSEITTANLHSQRLLEVEWANRKYKSHVQTLKLNSGDNSNKPGGDIDKPDGGEDPDKPGGDGETDTPTIKLTMDFSGNVWNDKNENISNGLKETDEFGIKGVEVFLYDANTDKQIEYTVTNEKGEYIFEKIPVGVYYILYTYDGQTYKTTKSFINGSADDYKQNANGKVYTNVSIVDETDTARTNLNNKFYEIKEGEAIGTDGKKITLNYKETGRTSSIITREEETEKAYQEFQISVDTKQKDIYFPATNTIIINGVPYLKIDNNNNINVGLSEREKTDENLRLDVYQTTFSMKGQKQTFLHNGKEIRDIDSNKVVNEYIQQVNPDDYTWRLDQYKDKVSEDVYKEIEEIYGGKEGSELEAYVEYMIILRNSGENDTVYITELADYYDKTLEYKDQYRDFDISSWVVIRNEDETESNYSGNNNKYQIKWTSNSRYGDKNEYSNQFNKMYANLENYGIKKGQYAEIHIVFRVLKDNTGKIILDQSEGKKNAAEINGYRTLDTETGKVAGLIDLDSKPGDLNPTQEPEVYEDDEDKAPNYKLQLGYSNGNNGGNDNNGNGGGNNGGNGDNIETDENGNVIGFGNTIEGNVWEDLRTDVPDEFLLKLDNNQVIGDVIKQENEPLVNDVKVELIEIISGTDRNGNYKEIEINLSEKAVLAGNETRTGNQLLLTEKANSEGAYRFSHLISGKYKIKFTYGEAKQLEKNIKYNGQDYQGISSSYIYDNEGISNKYKDTEIMLVMDNSNSMKDIKINHAKQITKELIENLYEKMPGVQIGLVNFNETANIVSNPQLNKTTLLNSVNDLNVIGETSIGSGIVQGGNSFSKNKTKIMILITDGQETVETEENVIKQIEQLRASNIGLTTILTSSSDNIFGTEAAPRYGKVYKIENSESISTTANKIYEELIKTTELETDRSLARDIEGNEEGTEPGTRRWQVNEYSEMNYKKATILDVEKIAEIADIAERNRRIAELANTTYMMSESIQVEFNANNVGPDKIHEVNQALLERPKAQLNLTQEIAGIKVTLSDGSVIIDTAKGLSKNVLGLDLPDANSTVSVYMDEEIMQGATVEVTYRLNLENVGEIDKLSNYFAGESDATIPTTAKVIYAYINQNVVYRENSQTGDAYWTIINLKDNKEQIVGELSPELIEALKEAESSGTTKLVLRTESLKEKALYPADCKEVLEGGADAKQSIVSTDLILSRVISPEDDESTNLTYTCSMEVTIRGNDVGRRVIGSIPGNHRLEEEGTIISLEADEATSRRIVITKPLGENRDRTYILIALVGVSIMGVGIMIFGKRKT